MSSKKEKFLRLFRPVLKEYNPGVKEKNRFLWCIMCPFSGKLAMWITKIIAALTIWGTFWAITGDEALPGGNFFGLLVLIYGCVIAAAFINFTPFPPLLGMMLVGFCLRNSPVLDKATHIDKTWAATLRTIALVVILVKAGTGLDPSALKKVKWMAIRLAFVPSLVEAVAAALVARFALGFPWIWSFVGGFVLSAVSPAVVVPCMIGVQEKGFGVDEGIPTLCIAACSLNDVFSISGFGVTLGIAFSNADLVYNIFHGPLEIVIGISVGTAIGVLLWYLPHKASKNLLLYRFILIISLGMFLTFGFRVVKYPGAGALGTLAMSFVAGMGWRKRGWETNYAIKPVLAKCWQVFQPLLFGLIGSAVSIENLQSGDVGKCNK
ncbi:hypothetical protein LOTGIDRAFT_137052 [Lottia gigantea]|uniref:Uncharacterized protein n=1 Tax=Lottia gigantea TaxID=225164 RepID=V4BC36_LOTGI|nr:hypothetical protein LOTGIDRAFT_137052 [Lottia gigantea]ESP03667.1 hypothetical protein LOTGIDRAFT_137052 [Lottia gigantea]